MADVLQPIYEELVSHKNTLAIIKVEKKSQGYSKVNNFDTTLVIVKKDMDYFEKTKHFNAEGETAVLFMIDEKQINNWLVDGNHPFIFNWILNGDIVFETNKYISRLRLTLRGFPIDIRVKKMGLEFARLIRAYENGRGLFENKHFLDSYNYMIDVLHHLGRFSLIDHGLHPEVVVWDQVKTLEPEVFKLYKELVQGNEKVEKRIELMLIASGFAIFARTKKGSEHILSVMKSEDEEWEYHKLVSQIELKEYGFNLQFMLEHLIDKGYISVRNNEGNSKLSERKYSLKV